MSGYPESLVTIPLTGARVERPEAPVAGEVRGHTVTPLGKLGVVLGIVFLLSGVGAALCKAIPGARKAFPYVAGVSGATGFIGMVLLGREVRIAARGQIQTGSVRTPAADGLPQAAVPLPAEATAEVVELRERIAATARRLETSEQAVAQRDTEFAVLRLEHERVVAIAGPLQTAGQELAQRNTELAQARQQLAGARTDAKTFDGRVQEAGRRNKELQTDMELAQGRRREVESQLAGAISQREATAQLLATAQQELAQRNTEFDGLRAQYEQLVALRESQALAVQGGVWAREQLQTGSARTPAADEFPQVTQLREQLAALRAREAEVGERAAADLGRGREELQGHVARIAELTAQLETARAEVAQRASQVQEGERATTDLGRAREELQAHVARIAELTAQLETDRAECERATTDLGRAREELQAHVARIAELTAQLETARAEVAQRAGQVQEGERTAADVHGAGEELPVERLLEGLRRVQEGERRVADLHRARDEQLDTANSRVAMLEAELRQRPAAAPAQDQAAQLRLLQDALEIRATRVADLEGQLEGFEKAKEQIAQYEQDVSKLEQAVAQVTGLMHQNSDLNRLLAEAREELQTSQAQTSQQVEIALAMGREQLAKLGAVAEERVGSHLARLEQMGGLLEQLKTEMQKLKAENERLRAQLEAAKPAAVAVGAGDHGADEVPPAPPAYDGSQVAAAVPAEPAAAVVHAEAVKPPQAYSELEIVKQAARENTQLIITNFGAFPERQAVVAQARALEEFLVSSEDVAELKQRIAALTQALNA